LSLSAGTAPRKAGYLPSYHLKILARLQLCLRQECNVHRYQEQGHTLFHSIWAHYHKDPVRDGGIGSEAEAPLSITIGSKDLRGLTWLRLLPPDKTGQLLVIWEASPSCDGRAHSQSDTYIWLICFLLTLIEPNFQPSTTLSVLSKEVFGEGLSILRERRSAVTNYSRLRRLGFFWLARPSILGLRGLRRRSTNFSSKYLRPRPLRCFKHIPGTS